MKKLNFIFLSLLTPLIISSCGNNNVSSSISETSISYTYETSELPDDEKRPIWLLAHRCNKNYNANNGELLLEENREVYKGLASGCNGVEVDLAYRNSDDEIVLFHSGQILEEAETLNQFLALPELNDSRMSMVLFDIKDHEYISRIVNIIHNYYENNPENQKIHFIYSVNELSKLRVNSDPYYRFREVSSLLWNNEALEIDYENDTDAVQNMFNSIKFTRGIFGNGIFSGQARGNIENSIKKAIEIKNNDLSNPYRFKSVESWTVNSLENQNLALYENVGLFERIMWGCDIVLLDGFKNLNIDSFDTFYAYTLFSKNKTVRLANISDYPFGECIE